MRLHPTGKFDNHAAQYRHIEARPLAAAMGAEIVGVDVARLTDAQAQEIRDALFRHKMIFLRGQNLHSARVGISGCCAARSLVLKASVKPKHRVKRPCGMSLPST